MRVKKEITTNHLSQEDMVSDNEMTPPNQSEYQHDMLEMNRKELSSFKQSSNQMKILSIILIGSGSLLASSCIIYLWLNHGGKIHFFQN